MPWTDAVFLTGLRHLIIVPAALFPIWLGYRLYLHGVSGKTNSFGFRAPLTKFVVSGCGPGVTFMGMGGAVLLFSLFFGARGSAREQIIGWLVADASAVDAPDDTTKKARKVDPSLSSYDADQILDARETLEWLEQPRSRDDLEAAPLSTLRDVLRLRELNFVELNGEQLQLTERREFVPQLTDLAACNRDARRLSVPGEAAQLRVGAPAQRNFEAASDVWFLLSIEDSGMYTITTSRPSLDADPVDTELTLYERGSPLGERIGYDDDQGDGMYSLLNEHLSAREYWLKVSSYCGGLGSFEVTVVKEADTLAAPCVSVPKDVNVLPLEVDQEPTDGRLDSDGHAWYRTDVDEFATYRILTLSQPSGKDVDTVVRLYRRDEDCLREIGFDDDGAVVLEPTGVSLFSLLSEDLERGQYWIEVSSFLSDSGDYRIQVTSGGAGQ